MKTLTIKDENSSGKVLNEIKLQFEDEFVTVQELISERIKIEIEKYKNKVDDVFKGLVVPKDIEERLNEKSRREIDIEKQLYIAFDAFNKNGFFILVDNEQVVELDEKFLVDETTNVSFIKLTPLVGG